MTESNWVSALLELGEERDRLRAELTTAEFDRLANEKELARLRLAVRDQAGVELSEENDRLIALNSWLEADKAAISWTASGYLHEITDWRACAKFDLLMEGPRAMGWDHSALERCREKYVPKGE